MAAKAKAAGIAGEIISQMVPAVEGAISGLLSSGSSSLSMVKWRGNLDYEIEEIHGKVIMQGKNKEGGSIGVCKCDSALIGAEHNITFRRKENKEEVGKVYLCTYYSGAQPQAQLVFGDESFEQKIVTWGSSTCLILVYKPDL